MGHVSLIGMGLSPDDLTAKHLDLIGRADILVGGSRLLDFFEEYPAQKKRIDKDLKSVIRFIKENLKDKQIVVLSSGDPLFFGIGNVLIKSIGDKNITIYPNITTVSAAFSRIKEAWQDACVISLHGRDQENKLISAISTKDKIAVYTDPVKNPAWIASLLIKRKKLGFLICVFENLGTKSERINWFTPQEAAGMEFSMPNLVVLKRIENSDVIKEPVYFGMAEDRFDHEKGLITKAEVRAITLSKLRLKPDHILWDLGAGSGSVSIEAAMFITDGTIYAVEQNINRIEQIKKNIERFSVKNIVVAQFKLPEGMERLPSPDRIFIGGGGKDIGKIIESACTVIKSGGIIVVNTVLLQNINIAIEILKKKGFSTKTVQVQISRSHVMPWGERLESQNPVWIISAMKSLSS